MPTYMVAVLILGALAVPGTAFVLNRRSIAPHWHMEWSIRPRRALNGEMLQPGNMMRRRADGRYQYRAVTAEDMDRMLNEMLG